jgi:endonuclease/exonuclease/phosphatase family metal-dependent hydrolase
MSVHEKINVLHWNASGIRNKIVELYQHLTENHIDVACMCETFLKSNMQLYSHPDFSTYRLDREERAKGGVLIIIRNRIKHSLLPSLNTNLMECIGVQIELSDNSKLQIFSIYLPGGARTQEINGHFLNDIKKITRRRISYFAMGDFNSRNRYWNCSRANQAGSLLYGEFLSSNFLIMHPPTPTHFPHNNRSLPSTIDFALTNGLHNNTEPSTVSMNSDHCAVEFQILLNRIILKRIIAHADANNIIPEEQHGFKANRSTTHQLTRIINHIKNNFKINQRSTGMILLDVEKAFDRVWHSGLLYKLIKFKFPPYLIKFSKSIISNRSFQVMVKGN